MVENEVDGCSVDELSFRPLTEVADRIYECPVESDTVAGVLWNQRRNYRFGDLPRLPVIRSPAVDLDPTFIEPIETLHVLCSGCTDRLQRNRRETGTLRAVNPIDALCDERGYGGRGQKPRPESALPVHCYLASSALGGAAFGLSAFST